MDDGPGSSRKKASWKDHSKILGVCEGAMEGEGVSVIAGFSPSLSFIPGVLLAGTRVEVGNTGEAGSCGASAMVVSGV